MWITNKCRALLYIILKLIYYLKEKISASFGLRDIQLGSIEWKPRLYIANVF